MALYDDYFRNEDKPFAENLNDALLLSNVFDLTVDIEAPRMFSNSTWVDSTSTRKCGVSLLTLKEGLPTGVTVGTDSETGESVLTGTGTVELSIYPNFNSFGKYESFTWENTGSIVVNLKTTAGTTIASNISKGVIQSQSSELRTLQEIVVEIVFTNATLHSFGFVMANKQQTRYGATVGIDDVTGLDSRLDGVDANLTSLNGIIDDIQANDDYNVSVPINIEYFEGNITIYAKNNICHLYANLTVKNNVQEHTTVPICSLDWEDEGEEHSFQPIQIISFVAKSRLGKFVQVRTSNDILLLYDTPAINQYDTITFSCTYIIKD